MKISVKKNQTYNYFDDGKIRESRRVPVTITEIIPFNLIDIKTFTEWKKEVEKCYWLYAKETDFFIKGTLKFDFDKTQEVFFVRTLNDNGWFSLGYWAGRLDVDGSLTDSLNAQD